MSRTDGAFRLIEASPESIFAALIDPDALALWLPPAGMTARFDRFDAHPGGSYRLGISAEDHAAGLSFSLENLAHYLAR